ncbi:MAG: pyruvate, phosphate dikinase [Myxococcales bacterium]|nr:pyruvate, phosphate dikinase [Myxococcales bacterium]
MSQTIVQFGGPAAPRLIADRMLLGGKGAGLAEMAGLGLPVPPGFTLTTNVCKDFWQRGELASGVVAEMETSLSWLAALTGRSFGRAAGELPLLLSVRSGAPVSMPGMMDTILNLGLNDQTVQALAAATNSPCFAWDCYRRFIAMYARIVLGLGAPDASGEGFFEKALHDAKRRDAATRDADLSLPALQALVAAFLAHVKQATGGDFPQDVNVQLVGAIVAVMRSWRNPRAELYRSMHGIDAGMGTAVTVQSMVFGNLGEDCATGVVFTRNPATGARGLYGEFLLNAQGEDVVAGIRTPELIANLADTVPQAHAELTRVAAQLETHYRDMQDLEFTIEHGKLYMLQTRAGKRTGAAMVQVAVDLVSEGLITPSEALATCEPGKIEEVLHPAVDRSHAPAALAKGLPASPGAAVGAVVFSAKAAQEAAKRGDAVILVRTETSPEDLHGMQAAQGIITARGGMTSHAAVVARGMGKCCVTGCSALRVDAARLQASVGDTIIKQGDVVTVDGGTGELFLGALPLMPAKRTPAFEQFLAWADEFRQLKVRTNADTPTDAKTARAYGAEGIGLCRTEHMFFAPERILAMRQMILATSEQARREALATILPMQRADFVGLLREMDGLPVTVRLLDPPLHEFLPHAAADVQAVAAALGVSVAAIAERLDQLQESNPMLGHRGCRLGLSFPEIYETQVIAFAHAMADAQAQGVTVHAEIMIPLVMEANELALLRDRLTKVIDGVLHARGATLAYLLGTMIELPRACLVAGEIAAHADFFSFGTNDLTQTTFGISRDDVASFLPDYIERGILEASPFVTLDRRGVGELVRLAVTRGRQARPGLKLGLCGEHGGEPASVAFCHEIGLDYVSCSPFRVPVARVAAARAAILHPRVPSAGAPSGLGERS